MSLGVVWWLRVAGWSLSIRKAVKVMKIVKIKDLCTPSYSKAVSLCRVDFCSWGLCLTPLA